MTAATVARTCVLCGITSVEVTPSLALLAPTTERGATYTRMDRCRDRLSCRDRCEANGDRWPLARRGGL